MKAKVNGTRQLIGVITGTFPTPIPPPNHADLPPTSETCVRCHAVDQLVASGGPVKLVLQARYRGDEPNTLDMIALVLRPAGLGGATASRGVLWHIDSEVDYISSDPRAQEIDWVGIRYKDGATEEFIASSQVGMSTDIRPDIDRMKSTERERRMDCIDCHNRIGHGIPRPDQAIDDAIESGQIDQKPVHQARGRHSAGRRLHVGGRSRLCDRGDPGLLRGTVSTRGQDEGVGAVQGNLDPALLLGPFDTVADTARWILDQADGRPGHISNLGHGVLPETDADDLRRLVDFVHDHTPRRSTA